MSATPASDLGSLSFDALAAELPAPRPLDAAAVRAAIAAAGVPWLPVVIDDDPTGTQTVAGVPLVSRWTVDDLRWGMTQGAACLFVLANTRSLDPDAARRRVTEILAAVEEASRSEGVPYVVISRSDSTLRGHFPLETNTINNQIESLTGVQVDGVIFCPAYVEARRLTLGGVHWAAAGEEMVPVAETPYATDRTFAYGSSDLAGFVREKSGGEIDADQIVPLPLDLVRGDPDELRRRLLAVEGGQVVLVDALCDEDLRAVAIAAIEAEDAGKRFVYRTGPSFVRARAGLDVAPPLDPAELPLRGERPHRGMVVVGSHVPLTSRQLVRLLADVPATAIEVPVPEVLEPGAHDDALASIADRAAAALAGGHAVIYTSRTLAAAADADSSLDLARQVSAFLVELTARVHAAAAPDFVVAKGGITSSDLATEALGIRRATVAGSMLPGLISVWRAEDGPAADTPYVVFPGNVGDDESLSYVVRQLEGASRC
ncbi:MAG: hypothetical protein QOH18_186 [Solirubrobacterales bacterium]|nr:hypothetical protein [Solirubrobacterales bacterium]